MIKYYNELTQEQKQKLNEELIKHIEDTEKQCNDIISKYMNTEIISLDIFKMIKDYFFLEMCGVKMEYTNESINIGRMLDFQCVVNASYEVYSNAPSKHTYAFILQFTKLKLNICYKTTKEQVIKFLSTKDIKLKQTLRVL